jgi:hypothetical protein
MSLYVWDASDWERPLKVRSALAHAGAVHGLALLPCVPAGTGAGAGGGEGAPAFPAGTFASASADGTVRLWNLNPRATLSRREALAETATLAGGGVARRISLTSLRGAGGVGEEDDAPASSGGGAVGARPGTAATAATGVTSATAAAGPLPGARARNIFMREQLAVFYADGGGRAGAGGEGEEDGAAAAAARLAGFGGPGYPREGAPACDAASWSARAVITAHFDTEVGWTGPSSKDAGAPGSSKGGAAAAAAAAHGGGSGAGAPHGADSGLRALAAHPLGIALAVGDRAGNVRVFSLAPAGAGAGAEGGAVPAGALASLVAAHDGEITALAFSPEDGTLLASASRDRLVHVFDARALEVAAGVSREAASGAPVALPLLATLSDHSSAVNVLAFAPAPQGAVGGADGAARLSLGGGGDAAQGARRVSAGGAAAAPAAPAAAASLRSLLVSAGADGALVFNRVEDAEAPSPRKIGGGGTELAAPLPRLVRSRLVTAP